MPVPQHCDISRQTWRLTDLRLDDDLHDCEEGVRLLTGVHALEPLVAVLVGLLQRHVQVVVRLLGGKVLQRMKQARLHSLFLKQGQAASWNLAFTLAKLPDTDYCTHYDVELGVDVDQLVLVVHDGQRRDSEVDKLVERLDDGVAQHVEGERREVLERVHHRVDEVVVQLGGNSVML